ncbi:MAG: hypothetical protein M1489_00265 [Firmicutes bacterium]|nr:hypothetical protein [Bacillota bacterium]
MKSHLKKGDFFYAFNHLAANQAGLFAITDRVALNHPVGINIYCIIPIAVPCW